MEIFLKVFLLMGKQKVLEYTGGQMEENMKGIIRKEEGMDKECELGVMEMFIKVSL